LGKYDKLVIKNNNFKYFRKKLTKTNGIGEFFKGNPKVEKKGSIYEGKYSTYQSHDETPTVNDIESSLQQKVYEILTCLKNNYCVPINDSVFQRLTSTSSMEELNTILNIKKEKTTCCKHAKKA